jgi:hypothetical protein
VNSPPYDEGSLGHIVIGAQEIYNVCIELRGQVSEMRGDVRELSRTVDDLVKDQQDHEDRLRAVERKAWAIPSASTAVAVIALIFALIGQFG